MKRPAAFPPPSFLSLDGRWAVLSARRVKHRPGGLPRVPAHAGNRPEDGRKAIDAMAAAIPQLKHLASEIDGTAISTGLVSGGTTANTVAEHASVTFDLRYGSDRDRDELIFRMRKLCLTGFADGVTSDLKIESLGPALPLSAESASLITLINRPPQRFAFPPCLAEAGGASDGNELASFGVAVIDAWRPPAACSITRIKSISISRQ
mgnify:CR=1 FL=1